MWTFTHTYKVKSIFSGCERNIFYRDAYYRCFRFQHVPFQIKKKMKKWTFNNNITISEMILFYTRTTLFVVVTVIRLFYVIKGCSLLYIYKERMEEDFICIFSLSVVYNLNVVNIGMRRDRDIFYLCKYCKFCTSYSRDLL